MSVTSQLEKAEKAMRQALISALAEGEVGKVGEPISQSLKHN